MTIPRELDPATGARLALPDFRAGAATLERMLESLRGAPEPRPATRRRRALLRESLATATFDPPSPVRTAVLHGITSAALLGGAVLTTVLGVLLMADVAPGHAPGLDRLVLLAVIGALTLLLAALGARSVLVGLTAARARVTITADGVVVAGILRQRTVAWREIVAVESRVVHPVHWLTAGLRLCDGSRVLLTALDRCVLTWSRPTGPEVRALRTARHRWEQGTRTLH